MRDTSAPVVPDDVRRLEDLLARHARQVVVLEQPHRQPRQLGDAPGGPRDPEGREDPVVFGAVGPVVRGERDEFGQQVGFAGGLGAGEHVGGRGHVAASSAR
ncbi:hypothetical protein ACU686_23840 [Yinghuangia aomiensis]